MVSFREEYLVLVSWGFTAWLVINSCKILLIRVTNKWPWTGIWRVLTQKFIKQTGDEKIERSHYNDNINRKILNLEDKSGNGIA